MFATETRLNAGAGTRAPSAIRRALLAAGASGVIALAAPAAAGALTVSPMPGTPDATPETQISILGTPASNIGSVSVTGSVSGSHSGHLQPYSAAAGASFLPDAPFEEGEEVTAVVTLKEGSPVEDHFTVAHLAPSEALLSLDEEKPEELEHFKTEPELRPPKVRVNVADPSLEGDFFLDPLPSPTIHPGAKLLEFEPVGPDGLMILNPEGKLVWWDQLAPGEVGGDLKQITYEGQKALAWWQGRVTVTAQGLGEGIIANTAYEPIAHIKAGNGQQADIHELYISPDGTAWIDAYAVVCKPVCDSEHVPVVDANVQEIDTHTGLVMWQWNAMGHIAESESEVVPANGVFDPYHLNSIQPLPNGTVLLSLRDTSGVYLLNQSDGSILWQIAGKKSSFTRGKGTQFYFQHDARLEGSKLNRLTLFDDEAGPPVFGSGRGLILKLSGSKVTLVHQYLRPTTTIVPAEGSMQRMKGGNAVVGFGASPYFSEFARGGERGKRGKLLFDAQLPKGDGTYRVLRFNWEATPNTLPKLVAESGSPGEVVLYASWNGASAVAEWQVLGGESAESLTPLGVRPWSGFETRMPVSSTDSVFQVQALDKHGHVLATSAPVTAP
jgi:hypothetical protein